MPEGTTGQGVPEAATRWIDDPALDTAQAAHLLGVTERRIRQRIDDGELPAEAVEAQYGRGGKIYQIRLGDLPVTARLRYWAERDTDYPLLNKSLNEYEVRYGKAGMDELWTRVQAVLECRAVDKALDGSRCLRAEKEQIAARYGMTLPSLYRYCKGFAAQGIAGVMRRTAKEDKGTTRSMCPMAQDVVRSLYLTSDKKSNNRVRAELYRIHEALGKDACKRCVHCGGSLARREMELSGRAAIYELCDRPGDGMRVPGKTALNAFVARIPADQKAYARYGPKYWEAKYMLKAERIKPDKVNECWFGDHHMFDLFVVDDDGGIVRPWMTAWADAATGCFVSYCVSTNPNSSTIIETLTRGIVRKAGSPFWGMPSCIYIDNGKDYRCKRLEGDREADESLGCLNARLSQPGMLRQLGISVIHAQPYKAWSKTIERLFGTLEDRYIRGLPGWCGGKPGDRPEDLGRAKLQHMAARGELLTLQQFAALLREQIIPAYHAERFDNASSPLELYNRLPRAREDLPSWDALELLRMHTATRKVSYMGIKLHNRWYWDEALRHLVDREVTIRYSDDEADGITVLLDDRFACYALPKERLQLIGEEPERVAAHVAKQRRTRQEVRSAIADTHQSAERLLRNVVYEQIDPAAVGCTVTGIEYHKAAQARRAALQEQRQQRGEEPDEARDQVFAMLVELGRNRKPAVKREPTAAELWAQH